MIKQVEQKDEPQVEIRLVKAITANVNGQTHSLPAGRQRVPKSIADNWFVQSHTDNDGQDEPIDMRDAQILELSTQNGQLRDELQRSEEARRAALQNEDRVASLGTELQAMTAERDSVVAERDDLAKRVADLESTIALSAPGDTKPADTKSKQKG